MKILKLLFLIPFISFGQIKMFSVSNTDYSSYSYQNLIEGEFNNGKSIILFSSLNTFNNLLFFTLIRKSANDIEESKLNITNYTYDQYPISACLFQDESIIIGSPSSTGFILNKISSTNSILWSKSFDTPEMVGAYHQHKIISIDNGGSYLMISAQEFLGVIKLDYNGNILWSKKIVGINSSGKSPGFAITKNTNGGVLCTLKDDSYQSVVSLDSNGNLLWGKSFVDWNYRWPLTINTTNNGDILIAGNLDNSTIYFNKLNSQGDLIYAKYLNNNQGYNSLQDLKLDFSNNSFAIIQLDYNNNNITNSMNLMKFDSNGNFLWNESIDGIEYPNAFAISEINNLNFSAVSSINKPVFVKFDGNLGANCNSFSMPAYNFVDDTEFMSSLISEGANISDLIVITSDISFSSNSDLIVTESNFCDYYNEINEIKQIDDFTIYPNPTNSNFMIESEYFNSEQTIEIQDNTGRVLMKLENLNDSVQINATSFNSGIYFVVLKNNNETLSSKRLVIN